MNQSRDFKNERHAALHQIQVANGWYMGRDEEGNAVMTPITRQKRPGSRMSRRERVVVQILIAIYLPAFFYLGWWLGNRLIHSMN